MSHFEEYGYLNTTYGAIYNGVPATLFIKSLSNEIFFEKPKSAILITLSCIKIFAGFKSLCIIDLFNNSLYLK